MNVEVREIVWRVGEGMKKCEGRRYQKVCWGVRGGYGRRVEKCVGVGGEVWESVLGCGGGERKCGEVLGEL